jgi:hypothetical protein
MPISLARLKIRRQVLARTGLGTKIIFAQSGFSHEIFGQIVLGGIRGEVDVSHMLSINTEVGGVGSRQKASLEISGIKDMSFSLHFDDEAEIPPLHQEAETIILQFPKRKELDYPSTLTTTGFLKDYTITTPLDGKVVVECIVGFSGNAIWKRAPYPEEVRDVVPFIEPWEYTPPAGIPGDADTFFEDWEA